MNAFHFFPPGKRFTVPRLAVGLRLSGDREIIRPGDVLELSGTAIDASVSDSPHLLCQRPCGMRVFINIGKLVPINQPQ